MANWWARTRHGGWDMRRTLDGIVANVSPREFASWASTPSSTCALAMTCLVTDRVDRAWNFDADVPFAHVPRIQRAPHAWSSHGLNNEVRIEPRARVHATYRVLGTVLVRVYANRTVAALVY